MKSGHTLVMSRPEFKKPAPTRAKRKRITPGTERFSVSQAKARLSEVLRLARDGQSVIVTDHGQDIVRIEAISGQDQLSLILPMSRFGDVKNVRAPAPEHPPMRSALELLREDRARR